MLFERHTKLNLPSIFQQPSQYQHQFKSDLVENLVCAHVKTEIRHSEMPVMHPNISINWRCRSHSVMRCIFYLSYQSHNGTAGWRFHNYSWLQLQTGPGCVSFPIPSLKSQRKKNSAGGDLSRNRTFCVRVVWKPLAVWKGLLIGEALGKLTLLWEYSHGIKGLSVRNLLPCGSHETSRQLLWQPQSVPCQSEGETRVQNAISIA